MTRNSAHLHRPARSQRRRPFDVSVAVLESLEDRTLLSGLTPDVFSAASIGDYGPFHVQTQDGPSPIDEVSVAEFSRQWQLQTAGSDQRVVADEFIDVSAGTAFGLSGWAKSGDEFRQRYDPANLQSFGLESYDADYLPIEPKHVLKYAGATDTTLAATLRPGDNQFVVADANGWSISSDAATRALAWYGYSNASGQTYPDYTYTRNVAAGGISGLWSAAGVNAGTGVISLNAPWDGPEIFAGTAVRNAMDGADHSTIGLNGQSVAGDFTFRQYVAVIDGIDTGSGSFASNLLPVGTAFVRPIVTANEHGDTSNFITWREVVVKQLQAGEGIADLQHPDIASFSIDQPAGAGVVSYYDYFSRSAAFIEVQPERPYRIAASMADITIEVEWPLGFESFDADHQLIHSLHVRRFASAADAFLAANISPGDMSVFVTNAAGWSNAIGEPSESRSLAWYGYSDSTGYTYPNFTYTRNVAFDFSGGLWGPDAITFDGVSGNWRIDLRQPWSGPAVTAGTAVRNATGHDHQQLLNIATDLEYRGIGRQDEIDRFTYEAVIGQGTWQNGVPNERTFRPGTAFVKPVAQGWIPYGDDWLQFGPVADFPVNEPQSATFDGQPTTTPDRSLQTIRSDQNFVVDTNAAYVLSADVAAGSPIDGTQTTEDLHSFGYLAYDADGLPIRREHVARHITATDTTLAVTLNQDDTTITLTDATGWSNTGIAATRALAWFNYIDSLGTRYSDYTYTRNVLFDEVNGLWNFGGISGNVITLRQPWTGPTLIAGTPVRNAAGGNDLYAAIVDHSSLTNSWQSFHATVSGEWTNGTASQNAFPPGTASIRLAGRVNESNFSDDDTVHLRRLAIAPTSGASAAVSGSNQVELDLDVLANDSGTGTLTVIGVSTPDFGSVGIVVGGGPDGRDIVRYTSSAWFVGTDVFEYTVRDSATGENSTTTAAVSVTGFNLQANAVLAASISIQAADPNVNTSPPKPTRVGPLQQTEYHLIESGHTLHADNQPVQSLLDFSEDADGDSLAVRLITGVAHGRLNLNADGTFTYTSLPGYAGPDVFRYEVTDGVHSEQRTAQIIVLEPDSELLANRLQDIGLALYNHHDSNQRFPYDPYDYSKRDHYDASGFPLVSWRVHLLPYLGYANLYNQFRLNEPWDSPHNIALLDQMPDAFRSPGDNGGSTTTQFQLITDFDDLLGGPYMLRRNNGPYVEMGRVRDIIDGVGNTILVAQSAPGLAVPWTAPFDMDYDPADPFAAVGNLPDGRLNMLMADGSVNSMELSSVSAAEFHGMVTRQGREIVDGETLQRRDDQLNAEPLPADLDNVDPSRNNVRRLVLAMHNFHDTHGRFPIPDAPQYFDENGLPLVSWRVYLLPYLDHRELYNQFHLDEPWDSPHNLTLIDKMPDIFRSVGDSWDSITTRLQVFTGPDAPFLTFKRAGDQAGPKIRDFFDGTSNTILLAEVGPDRSVLWTAPTDAAFDIADPYAALGDLSAGEFRVGMADGSSFVLPTDLPPADLAVMVTPGGREINDARPWFNLESHRRGLFQYEVNTRIRLKSIGLGAHNYHDVEGGFPVFSFNPAIYDANGKSHLSWRVHILPYIEQAQLYTRFNLQEPWDSPSNLPLLSLMPDVFRSIGDPWDSTTTRFQIFQGGNAPFPNEPGFGQSLRGPRIRDITDGTSSTIFAVETGPEVAVSWTQPDDINFDPARLAELLGTLDGDILRFLLMDGSVQELSFSGNEALAAAMVTSRGGESLSSPLLRGAINAGITANVDPAVGLVILEGGLGAIDLVLDKPGNVVIDATISVAGVVLPDKTILTFTTANWNIPQTITFQAIDDALFDDPETTVVTLAVNDALSTDEFDLPPDIVVPIFNVSDDVPPSFTVLNPAGSVQVSESGTSETYTVVLGAKPVSNVVLSVTSSDPSEASVSQSTLTFTPTDWNNPRTFTVTGEDDAVVDGDRTAIITVSVIDSSSDDGFDPLLDQTFNVINVDDDAATISINSVVLPEGDLTDTAFTFAVTLDAQVDIGVVFGFVTADGTATVADGDFTGTAGLITFPPNSPAGSTQAVTVIVGSDRKVELDEQFAVLLSGLQATGRNVSLAASLGTATIVNDDAATISISDVTLTEGNAGQTSFTFAVTLDAESDIPVSMDYGTSDITATIVSGDYTPVTGGQLSFPAGSPAGTIRTFSIQVHADEIVELDERFGVTLSNLIAGGRDVAITNEEAVATIVNDDTATIRINDVTRTEGNAADTSFVFSISLDAAVDSDVLFDLATVDGSAIAGTADYRSVSATAIGFAANSSPTDRTLTVVVPVRGDSIVERDETFLLTVSNLLTAGRSVTLAGGGSTISGLGTITNDDAATIRINDVAVTEGDVGTTNLTFTVTLDGEIDTDVAIDYATAIGTASAADFNQISGTLNFASAPGISVQTTDFTVQVIGDEKVELDETFFTNLSGLSAGGRNVTFSDDQAIGTILHDDSASISIANVTQNEGDSGITEFIFTLLLDGEVDAAVSFSAATSQNSARTSDGDFTAVRSTMTFVADAGSMPQTTTLLVQVAGDDKVELDESFLVNLSGLNTGGRDVTIGDDQAIGTVLNDDSAAITIADAVVVEGNSGLAALRFDVILSNSVDVPVSLSYATIDDDAAAGSDYVQRSGTISFPANSPGPAAVTVTVQVHGDRIAERNETLFFDLSGLATAGRNVTLAASRGTGTITNDDAATLSINNVSAAEGDSGSTVFFFEVSLSGDVDTGFTVDFSTTDNTATASDSDYLAQTTGTIGFAGSTGEIQTVSVEVIGDRRSESNETFFVDLSNIVAGGRAVSFANSRGVATIINDDAPPLDVDSNGMADAATDGILAIRYLFGFRGNVLTDGAIGHSAVNNTPATVESILDASHGMLDVDGNGVRDAATDGILIIRYLFGFRDESLVAGAIGSNATRTSGAEIAAFLDSFNAVPTTPPSNTSPGAAPSRAAAGGAVPSRVATSHAESRMAASWIPDAEQRDLFSHDEEFRHMILSIEQESDDSSLTDQTFESRVDWLSVL